MIEVRVPDIGDFTDVPVIEIHVNAGDEVAVEDPLVTLESDKATMDVPAPVSGIVQQLAVKIGDRVSEGSVLLTLEGVEDAAAVPEQQSAEESGGGDPAERAPSSGAAEQTETAPTGSTGDASYDFDVVVIGAGPGGYTAAFRAADLGLRVG